MEIRNTLRTHMRNGYDSFHESLDPNTQHNTHMLRDDIRQIPGEPTASVQGPAYAPTGPDDAPAAEEDDSQPVQVPLPATEALVIHPPVEISPGEPNMVMANVELARRIGDIVQELYGIPPDYNLQAHFDQLMELVNVLMDNIREILQAVSNPNLAA